MLGGVFLSLHTNLKYPSEHFNGIVRKTIVSSGLGNPNTRPSGSENVGVVCRTMAGSLRSPHPSVMVPLWPIDRHTRHQKEMLSFDGRHVCNGPRDHILMGHPRSLNMALIPEFGGHFGVSPSTPGGSLG